MKQYLLKVWMTAALSLLALGGVWGQTAPTVVSLSPSNGATGVSVGTTLSIQFENSIIANPTGTSSNLFIKKGSTILHAYASINGGFEKNYASTTEITISGNVITVDFPGDLEEGTEYTVEITDGFVYDTGTNTAGVSILGTEGWSFTTESTIVNYPTIAVDGLSPANGATGVSVGTTLSIQFENLIIANPTGTVSNLFIKKGSTILHAYASINGGFEKNYASTTEITISGNVITVDFPGDLEEGTEYTVEITDGFVYDTGTNTAGVSILGTEGWSFTTESTIVNYPTIAVDGLSPVNVATGVSVGTTLSIQFENPIIANPTGTVSNLFIKKGSTILHAYASINGGFEKNYASTTEITISGNVITVDFPGDLEEGTEYTVEITDGFVYDTGTNTAGVSILGTEGWSFTTESTIVNYPTIAVDGLSPANVATGVPVGTTLSIEFESPIIANPTGTVSNLFIKEGSTILHAYASINGGFEKNYASTTEITISGNVITVDFPGDLEEGTEYTVEITDGFVYDTGTNTAGVSVLGTEGWSFTTEVAPAPLLMITSSLSPADGAVEVPRAPTLEVTFDQEITWGPSGVLTIHRYDNDATAATISREQTGASISQDQLSIVFSAASLEYGTKYYVVIDEGFVKALNTSAVFAGLSDKEVWTFTTETAPPVWAEGYPRIENQTASDFDLEGKIDQDGICYFVVSDQESMPTYEEIRSAATSGGTGGFLAAGNDPVVADTEFGATISTANLEAGENYSLFVFTSAGGKDGEIVRLTIDRTVPRLRTTGTFPSAWYLVMPIDEDIVLTFSERIYGVEEDVLVELTTENVGSFIELVAGETSVSIEISISEDGRVFTLSPTAPLLENTSYSVVFSELSDAQFNVASIPAHTFSTDGLNEWTGLGAAGSWSDVSNWSGGYTAGKSVIIPYNSLGNHPVISSDVEVNNLTINPGASLTHNGGELTVSGEFIIKSSVDVNGSYINSGAEGVNIDVDGDKVRVEQVINDVYMTYLISAPTKGTTTANFGGYFPLYLYDNATDTWPAVTYSHQMQAGVGYRMWTDDPIVFFSGEFNTGGVQVPLTYTNGKGYGWNLVGNPYSASIDWTLLNVIENSKNIEDNFWVWMPTQRAYGAYSASTTIPLNIESSIIPSNHAFLVKVISPEEQAHINFDPSAQLVNSNNYLKAGSTSSTSYVKLAGVFGNVKDEMAVAFIDDASMGLDRYDMEKRFANQKHVFELFTNISNLQAAINAIPLEESFEVPLGYNAMVAGDFAIEMVKDNAENISCILVDKLLDVEQALVPGVKYEFSAVKGKDTSRFVLKFSKIATSAKVQEEVTTDFNCYVNDGEIFVTLNNATEGVKFQVADVHGRILHQGGVLDSMRVSLGIYEPGVYVLTISGLGGKRYGSQKVVVY